MSTPPLSWSIDTNALSGSSSFSYEATAEELAALERYLEVENVSGFSAAVRVTPLAQGRYRAAGRFVSALVQASVVNLEMVKSRIEEEFSAEYWPPESIESAEDDTLTMQEEQPEAIIDGRLQIGALLCELLALTIDPYPRNEDDTLEWTSPESENKLGPFASLQQLRPKKGGDAE
jgi:hypothetical protein